MQRFRTYCVFETIEPVDRVMTFLLYVPGVVTTGDSLGVSLAVVSLILYIDPNTVRCLSYNNITRIAQYKTQRLFYEFMSPGQLEIVLRTLLRISKTPHRITFILDNYFFTDTFLLEMFYGVLSANQLHAFDHHPKVLSALSRYRLHKPK